MVDRQIHSVQQAEDDQLEPSPVPDADQRHGDESRRNDHLKETVDGRLSLARDASPRAVRERTTASGRTFETRTRG